MEKGLALDVMGVRRSGSFALSSLILVALRNGLELVLLEYSG